jgi:hypothetical protein
MGHVLSLLIGRSSEHARLRRYVDVSSSPENHVTRQPWANDDVVVSRRPTLFSLIMVLTKCTSTQRRRKHLSSLSHRASCVAVRLPALRPPPGICSRTSGAGPFAVVSPPTYIQMSNTHTKQQCRYQCISVCTGAEPKTESRKCLGAATTI